MGRRTKIYSIEIFACFFLCQTVSFTLNTLLQGKVSLQMGRGDLPKYNLMFTVF